MNAFNSFLGACLISLAAAALGQTAFEQDTIPTSKGDLRITFIGHGTLMFLPRSW